MSDGVVPVQLGSVAEANPGQNTAEYAPQVEQFSVDEPEWTAAVLLIPGARHRGVEQSYGILADSLITGRFSQGYALL